MATTYRLQWNWYSHNHSCRVGVCVCVCVFCQNGMWMPTFTEVSRQKSNKQNQFNKIITLEYSYITIDSGDVGNVGDFSDGNGLVTYNILRYALDAFAQVNHCFRYFDTHFQTSKVTWWCLWWNKPVHAKVHSEWRWWNENMILHLNFPYIVHLVRSVHYIT